MILKQKFWACLGVQNAFHLCALGSKYCFVVLIRREGVMMGQMFRLVADLDRRLGGFHLKLTVCRCIQKHI